MTRNADCSGLRKDLGLKLVFSLLKKLSKIDWKVLIKVYDDKLGKLIFVYNN